MLPDFPLLTKDIPLNKLFSPICTMKGPISQMYLQIHSLCPEPLNAIGDIKRHGDMEEISEALLEEILSKVHRSSIFARHALN